MPVYAYECKNAHCRRRFEEYRPMTESAATVPCPRCGKAVARDYHAEVGVVRCGELPDWVSLGAGVPESQIGQASREYAHLGVKFDSKGRAHVPGKNRARFLKESGLHDRGGTRQF